VVDRRESRVARLEKLTVFQIYRHYMTTRIRLPERRTGTDLPLAKTIRKKPESGIRSDWWTVSGDGKNGHILISGIPGISCRGACSPAADAMNRYEPFDIPMRRGQIRRMLNRNI